MLNQPITQRPLDERRSYPESRAQSDRAEAIAGIRRGLESKAQSRGIPAAEAFETLRARHEIPRDR